MEAGAEPERSKPKSQMSGANRSVKRESEKTRGTERSAWVGNVGRERISDRRSQKRALTFNAERQNNRRSSAHVLLSPHPSSFEFPHFDPLFFTLCFVIMDSIAYCLRRGGLCLQF